MGIASSLAIGGIGLTAVRGGIVVLTLGGAVVFLLAFDLLKAPLFARLELGESHPSDARGV